MTNLKVGSFSNEIELHSEADIVIARGKGRTIAAELGFGIADQTRFATAISELTRNVIQHAGTGRCRITGQSEDAIASLKVVVEDHGPGIADVALAMQFGFSTKKSMGAGLPGTRRLVDEFDILSEPGHTVVTIAVSRRLPR